MQVTVSFRGICLFVERGSSLHEVILPDANGRRPREADSKERHIDGSKAREHHAGLVTSLEPRKHKKLTNGVSVVIGTTGKPKPASALGNLPRLPGDQLEIDRAPMAASIRLEGGTITTKFSGGAGRKFKFGNQGVVDDHVNVTFKEVVTITVNGQTTHTLDPKDGATLFVYNMDDENPTPGQLKKGRISTAAVIDDDDFKWHFLIAAPPAKDANDKEPLKRWALGALPCPRSIRNSRLAPAGRRQPDTIAGSTCYPAVINEDERRSRRP